MTHSSADIKPDIHQPHQAVAGPSRTPASVSPTKLAGPMYMPPGPWMALGNGMPHRLEDFMPRPTADLILRLQFDYVSFQPEKLI